MIKDELEKLQADAVPAPDVAGDTKRALLFRYGYAAGYQDALREAIEIAEEDED